MLVGKYIGFFFLSTFKFLFTPMGGPAAGLSFLETYLSCIGGAIFSASIFYFAAEYFMKRALAAEAKRKKEYEAQGKIIPQKKKFTKMNKYIVKLKKRFGIYGIAMYAPLFLSVPIGSIVTAKFFGRDKRTYPIMLLGICLNGAIISGLTYLVASFF